MQQSTHRPATPEVLHGVGAYQFNVAEFAGASPRLAPCWHPALPEVRVLPAIPRTNGPGMIPGELCYHAGDGRWYGKVLSAILLLALAVPSFAQPAPAPCKVNVEHGTAAELALLPGVGEKTAALIVAAHPATLEALDAVKGIGTAKLAAIAPHAAFGDAETTCIEKLKLPRKATVPTVALMGKDGAR